MTRWTIAGVPASIQQDAWWMGQDAADATADGIWRGDGQKRAPDPLFASRQAGRAGLVLLALVALADVLFWGHRPGLSVALFGLALGGALALTTTPAGPRRPAGAAAAAVLLAGVLPAGLHLSPLSLGFATLSVGLAAILLSGAARDGAGAVLRLTARLFVTAPFRSASDAAPALRALAGGRTDGHRPIAETARRAVRNWAMALMGGLVFLTLLVLANPILDRWLSGLSLPQADLAQIVQRALFWTAMAALVWPLLSAVLRGTVPPLLAPPTRTGADTGPQARRDGLPGVDAISIGNALILFNALFAVQTALDLTYLWGGVALPEGMSYASYAHRGAYPLVATALLAGVFALLAQPFASRSRRLRTLLILWIAQNVLLMISAMLRLDLYVAAYGLTLLRLAAAIWMGLVATGLALTLWQIVRRHGNRWLLTRVAALGIATLYGCTFLNAPGTVAAFNTQRAETGLRVDRAYTCALGPMAAAELAAYQRRTGHAFCYPSATPPAPVIHGWRDWGLRKWRIRRYLLAETQPSAPEERL